MNEYWFIITIYYHKISETFTDHEEREHVSFYGPFCFIYLWSYPVSHLISTLKTNLFNTILYLYPSPLISHLFQPCAPGITLLALNLYLYISSLTSHLQHFNLPCHLPTSSAISHPRSHSLILSLIPIPYTAAPSLIPTPSSAISSPYPKPINSSSTSLSLTLFSHLALLHLNLYYWLWLFIYIHSLLSPTPYQKLSSFIPPLQYCTPQTWLTPSFTT